jgi:hypothetical protein
MRYIIVIIAAFFLISCGNNEENDFIKMPLYKGCVAQITKYLDKRAASLSIGSSGELKIQLDYFNYHSELHSNIIGSIKLTGNNLSSKLEVYANTIRGNCYPESVITVENTSNGMETVIDTLKRNHSLGIDNNYFKIDEESIKIYFNNGTKAKKRPLYEVFL